MRISTIDWFVVLVAVFADCESKLPLLFGYKFRYRHQFGLLTFNFAKPLATGHLSRCNHAINYAYLSGVYGILRKLKIRRGQPHGVRFPLRHQDNVIKINSLQRPKPLNPRGFFMFKKHWCHYWCHFVPDLLLSISGGSAHSEEDRK